MFNLGWDAERFASLGSSFDEPDPFAPTPVAPAPKKLPSAPEIVKASVTPKQERVIAKGPAFVAPVTQTRNQGTNFPSVDLEAIKATQDATPKPDTQAALEDFPSFLDSLYVGTEQAVADLGVGQTFDPLRTGNTAAQGKYGMAVSDINTGFETDVTGYIKDNDIPLTKEINGKTYHLTVGKSLNDLVHGRVSDGIWIEQGPVGTYSTVYQDTSTSFGNSLLNNPVLRAAAAVATGGVSEGVIAAGRGLAGETLHAGDWLSMATVGLNETGMLKAPASAEEARKIGELATQSGNLASGLVAEQLALSGVGLGPLTYSQSTALLNAAATGDPKSFIYSAVGNAAIDKVFKEATGTVEGMSDTGRVAGIFQSDDAKAGLLKVVDKLSSGEDFDKALIYGLGTYIKEGGGLNIPTPDGLGFDLPSVDLGILEDVAKKVGDELSDADTAVRKGLREFDKTIQPVTKEIGKGLSAAETLARQGLSEFDDAFIQPTGEFLSAADTAARKALTQLDEGLYDIQSPFSTPEIDLPSIDLPNLNLPSLGMGMGMLLSGAPAPTATTGKIFEDELFKFKNKIELTEFGPLNQPEQEVDIEEFLTSPFESAFTTSQRFA